MKLSLGRHQTCFQCTVHSKIIANVVDICMLIDGEVNESNICKGISVDRLIIALKRHSPVKENPQQ